MQARFQAVFVKAITRPGAGIPGVLLALQQGQTLLRLDGTQVKHRVGIVVLAHDRGRVDGLQRVERDHHGLLKRDALQTVEQIVQAHPRGLALAAGGAFVVPRGPGLGVGGQHAGIGVQHGAVVLVADRPQQAPLVSAGLTQQTQRLVGVGGDDHLVKAFGMAIGDDAHAMGVTLNQSHGGVQAFVVHARQNLLDIVAGTAHHAEPLRAVGHLDQAMVVAKPDHGRHRELQHLVGWATPDAAQHGQEIPVAKRLAEFVCAQKV